MFLLGTATSQPAAALGWLDVIKIVSPFLIVFIVAIGTVLWAVYRKIDRTLYGDGTPENGGLVAKVAGAETALASIPTTADGIKILLSSLTTDIAAMREQVDELEESVALYKQQIDKEKLDKIHEIITMNAAQGKLEDMQERVRSLQELFEPDPNHGIDWKCECKRSGQKVCWVDLMAGITDLSRKLDGAIGVGNKNATTIQEWSESVIKVYGDMNRLMEALLSKLLGN